MKYTETSLLLVFLFLEFAKFKPSIIIIETTSINTMWKGKDNPITIKGFYLILRMIEAESILKASDFKNLEGGRKVITDDILKALINQKDFSMKQAKQIANVYLKEFPILNSVKSYDKQDLALALSNHYHPEHLALDILHISEMTSSEAVAVATALLSDFDPTISRMDGTAGLGEFIKYKGKPGLYFNAIETRRAFQYQTFFGVAFDTTERYKLLNLDKPLVEAPEAHTAVTDAEPAHSHAEPEIELETVECEPMDSDSFFYDDGSEENNAEYDDQSYLDESLPENSDGEEFAEIDDDDINNN